MDLNVTHISNKTYTHFSDLTLTGSQKPKESIQDFNRVKSNTSRQKTPSPPFQQF